MRLKQQVSTPLMVYPASSMNYKNLNYEIETLIRSD